MSSLGKEILKEVILAIITLGISLLRKGKKHHSGDKHKKDLKRSRSMRTIFNYYLAYALPWPTSPHRRRGMFYVRTGREFHSFMFKEKRKTQDREYKKNIDIYD